MKWLRTSKAARILGVSRWTVRRLALEGSLEWRRVGSLMQINSDSLDTYQSRCAPVAPKTVNGEPETR